MKYQHYDKLNKRWFPYVLVVWKGPRQNRNFEAWNTTKAGMFLHREFNPKF